MSKPRCPSWTVLALGFAINAPCNGPETVPTVTVDEPYVELCAGATNVALLSFTMRTNIEPTKLISIETADAERVELWNTDGPMAPGETTFGLEQPLVFGLGGKKALLRGLKRRIKPGDSLNISYNVEPAEPVLRSATARLSACTVG